ncbi:MAG: GNAT family N-acetyltransferase [Dysgonomonas sp.]|nr:GNAT family N-acetyltransferase [Dysgonomonas sp.]
MVILTITHIAKEIGHSHPSVSTKGGYIFIVLYKDEFLGVCALIKMNDGRYDFELAKMAISPKAQGKNIGFLLGQAAVSKAVDILLSVLF